MSARGLTSDDLAALEEQRDFLLRSLDDLEAERAAGDVDEHDYEALRDGYTARAARMIRAIQAHRAHVSESSARSRRWQPLAVLAGVLVFAVLAGGLVVQAARQRVGDETLTGDIRATPEGEVQRALQLANQGEVEAAQEVLDGVLAERPDHVEATTYKGWVQVLSGDLPGGVQSLTTAAQLDPEYPDAHAFLVVSFFRLGNAANADAEQADYFHSLARRELGLLDDLDVPQEMQDLLAPIRAQLE